MAIIKIILSIVASIYVIGFGVTFIGHLVWLQMVTPQLALYRALFWPIYWVTGWPHGTPMPMD